MQSQKLQSKLLIVAAFMMVGLFGPLALEATALECHADAAPETTTEPQADRTMDSCCCDVSSAEPSMPTCPCDLEQAPSFPDEMPIAIQHRPVWRLSLSTSPAVPTRDWLLEAHRVTPPGSQSVPPTPAYSTNCALLR